MFFKKWVGISACTALLLSDFTKAVKNCNECPKEKTCLLENGAYRIDGQVASIDIKFCNFDQTKAASYELQFLLKTIPKCDSEQATVPLLKELTPLEPCTPDSCTVMAALEEPVDWAIAMRSPEMNTLSAKLLTGDDEPPVLLGLFPDVAGAAVTQATNDISVCENEIPINGWRFSMIQECNSVTLCRSVDGDVSCKVPLNADLKIDDVSCSKDVCQGIVSLGQDSFGGCESLAAAEKSVVVQVKVGDTQPSPFVKVGQIAAVTKNVAVTEAEGVQVGSSKIELSLGKNSTSSCNSKDIQVSLATADNKTAASVESVIVSEGVVTATLSDEIDGTLAGKRVQLVLSQCGVDLDPFTVKVSEKASAKSSTAPVASNTGGSTENSEPAKPSTGLKGGWIIGSMIGVMAVFGFFVEYYYHRKKYGGRPHRADRQLDMEDQGVYQMHSNQIR